MIIDLDLAGKTILVLGAGVQAEKRIRMLLGGATTAADAPVQGGVADANDKGCGSIIILTEQVRSEQIKEWSRHGLVRLCDGYKIRDASFVNEHEPDVLIAATDDSDINAMAVEAARESRILAYRSDSAGSSDYSHPALIRLEGGVTAAIFTGGKSPAVAKYVRNEAEPILKKIVTPGVVARLQIQDMIRQAARPVISDHTERKRLLDDVTSDPHIDRLIRDGRIRDAQERAMAMLGERS